MVISAKLPPVDLMFLSPPRIKCEGASNRGKEGFGDIININLLKYALRYYLDGTSGTSKQTWAGTGTNVFQLAFSE